MTSPATISLEAAIAMTNCSRRTWWRRMEKGSVTKLPADARGRAMLVFEEVRPAIGLPLGDEDVELLVQADGGDALAQAEAGALFALAHQKAGVITASQPASQPAILSPRRCIGWSWLRRKARRMPCTGWAFCMPAAMAVTTASTWR